jgi:multiple antibiotic resistance protein
MPEFNELLLFFVGAFVSLFSMVDPPMAAPVFVTLTQGMTSVEQKRLAWRASICVLAILLVFFAAGSLILNFFGISIDALRIAGGLMILNNAAGMLQQKSKLDAQEEREAEQRDDLAFSPLAMPLLSGPGSIAALIGMTADAKDWLHYGAIFLVIVLVALSCYWCLRISTKLVQKVGETTLKSFTKIMGFILLCVGVQYLVNGIKPILTTIIKLAVGH